MSFEIVDLYGGVMIRREDERGPLPCFIGRRHIGSPLGMPKVARHFASVAEAQSFCAEHKIRNVRIVPVSSSSTGVKS